MMSDSCCFENIKFCAQNNQAIHVSSYSYLLILSKSEPPQIKFDNYDGKIERYVGKFYGSLLYCSALINSENIQIANNLCNLFSLNDISWSPQLELNQDPEIFKKHLEMKAFW